MEAAYCAAVISPLESAMSKLFRAWAFSGLDTGGAEGGGKKVVGWEVGITTTCGLEGRALYAVA